MRSLSSNELEAPAAALLGAVHRGVGVAQEVGRIVVGALGERDAEARGDEVVARREHDRLADGLRDALGHPDRLARAVELLAHDQELVAAEPRHGVGRADRIVQPRRERDQQVVARRVAERVVDQLELVEVEQQHRHRPAVAAAAGERALEPVQGQRAVRQRRQRVVQRAMADLLLDEMALDRAGDDVGDGAQEVDLVGPELPRGAAVRAEHPPRRVAGGDRDRDARHHARGRERRGQDEVRRLLLVGADGPRLAERVADLRLGTRGDERAPHLSVGPAVARREAQCGVMGRDLPHGAQIGAERLGDRRRGPVHHLLEILLLERVAAQRGDGRLLARVALDRLLRRPLGRDVLHVRVEPAVAARGGHPDRLDGGPHHLAVRAQVALDEVLVAHAPLAAVDHLAADRDVVGMRVLARGVADERLARPAERPAQRVVDVEPAPVHAQDRHPDGRVREAALEAILARAPQDSQLAREQAERHAGADDDDPPSDDRVRDHRLGLAGHEDGEDGAVEQCDQPDQDPAPARRRGGEGVRRQADIEEREAARRVVEGEQRAGDQHCRQSLDAQQRLARRAVEPAAEQDGGERPRDQDAADHRRLVDVFVVREREPEQDDGGAAGDQGADGASHGATPRGLHLHPGTVLDGAARA